MLRALQQNSAKELLGAEQMGAVARCHDGSQLAKLRRLGKFCSKSFRPHPRAWKDFNQRVGSDGSVGVWHETFLVNGGHFECI
jgi:hypothetical protein